MPLGTFVPQFILEQFAAGRHNGRFQAAALFIDISGFTSLTEALFQYRHDGAENLSRMLEIILGPLASQASRAGGIIPLYAGDAFLSIFPFTDKDRDAVFRRVWQTAVLFRRHLMPDGQSRSIPTRYKTFDVGVRIGVASGSVQWGIPGRDGRYTFYFRGTAIDRCVQSQQNAQPGQILTDETMQQWVDDAQLTPNQLLADNLDLDLFRPANRPNAIENRTPSRRELQPFILDAILELPLSAEFRSLCPVFISFQNLPETALLHAFIADVIEVVHQYGGTFSQLDFSDKGGIIVIWFGAPIGYENNAVRAAKCLLALNERGEGANHPLWRSGWTYGLAWTGIRGAVERQEYGVLGDVVNLAARVAMKAEWGQIWLDHAAANQLQGFYQLLPLGDYTLKGKRKNHQLYQLIAPKEELRVMYKGKMMGRMAELDQLQTAVAPIFDREFGGLAIVYGDPGIGKSRLLFELRQTMADRVIWLECPADVILNESLYPFRHYLRDHFNQSSVQTIEQNQTIFNAVFNDLLNRLAEQAGSDAAFLHAELTRLRSFLAALVDLQETDSLYEQLNPQLRFENSLLALSVFFRTLSLQHPVVIQLEDIQWLDDDSGQLVTMLTRQLKGYPAVILCTSRYGDGGVRPTLRIAAGTLETTIMLQKLNREAVRSIVHQILQAPAADEVIDFLMAKSNGTPFFAEQLTLDMQEQKLLLFENGRFQITKQAQIGVPTTINDLLISRLDRLDSSVKQVVQTAAILGERFRVRLLSAMLAQDQALPDKLQQATDKQIWSMLDQLRYLFKHALLRDAAYEMQLLSHRRHAHRLAAETMERLYSDNLSHHLGEIAFHYETAYRLGDSALLERAKLFLRRAGVRSIKNYENASAVDYFSRSLTLTKSGDTGDRFELLLARESVYARQGHLEKQAVDLLKLEGLAAQLGPAAQAKASLRRALYADSTSDYPTAIAAVNQSIQWALQTNQTRIQTEALMLWGMVLQRLGRYTDARKQYHEGLRLAESNQWIDLQADILQGLSFIANRLSDFELARRLLYEGRELARMSGNRQLESWLINSLGLFALDKDRDYTRAKAFFQEAITLRREFGDLRGEGIVLKNLGNVAYYLGDYATAQEYYRRCLRLRQQTGDRRGEGKTYGTMGAVAVLLEAYDDARNDYQQALAIAREIGDQRGEGFALSGMGDALMGLQRINEARNLYRKAIALRGTLGEEHLAVESLAALARSFLIAGDGAAALRYVNEILDFIAAGNSLGGAEKSFIYVVCIQTLAAQRDERKGDVLETAVFFLQEQANLIPDTDTRYSFLNNVPWHKEIMRLKALQSPD